MRVIVARALRFRARPSEAQAAALLAMVCVLWSVVPGCARSRLAEDPARGVGLALVAEKNADVDAYKRYVYSRSGGYRLTEKPAMFRRMLTGEAKDLGLDRMSDAEILRSVEVVPGVDKALLASIVAFNEGKGSSKDSRDLTLAAVRYRIPAGGGKDMLAVAVRENGCWKANDRPYWTINVLRYRNIRNALRDERSYFSGR